MSKKQLLFTTFLILAINYLAFYYGSRASKDPNIGMTFFVFALASISVDIVAIVIGGRNFYQWLAK